MSQTETTISSDTQESKAISPPTSSNSQVAPHQEKLKKGKKQSLDPEYVKSPLASDSNENLNRPVSTRSLKPSQKGGFLSLLLCCTVGAGSYLDNSDKSSLKKNVKRNNSQPIKENNIVPPIVKSPEESEKVQKNIPTPTIDTEPINDKINTDPEVSETTSPTSPTSPIPPVSWLLPPLDNEDKGRQCLVLDLDETLVHSSFKMIPNPDFIVPVEIDNQYHNVYVLKRPGVDEFMRKMGEKYEIVVFTASLAKYADPVLDMLDIHRVVKHRLFRESCCNHKGTYVKDLSLLGRDLTSTLILDNSPASYIFHNANAVPVSTWFNDPHDTELTDLVAFLEDLTIVDDIQIVLDNAIESI